MNKAYSLIDDWPLPKGVSALVSHNIKDENSRVYGDFNLALHVGDAAKKVKANRARLLASQPSLKAVQWLNQTHGVEVVNACGNAIALNADACVSQEKGLAAAVLTADCLPVLFVNQQGTQVAAAHAGWRGLAQGILLNTLAHFKKPNEVSVYFGAAIGFDAFEVGLEVRQAFSWAHDSCFKPSKANKLYANLYAIAKQQLAQAGVHQFFGGKHCTYNQPEYYSYRCQSVTGRQVSMIWLEHN